MSSHSNRSKRKFILIFSVILFVTFVIVFAAWAQAKAEEAKNSIEDATAMQEATEPLVDEPESEETSEEDDDKTSDTSESEENNKEGDDEKDDDEKDEDEDSDDKSKKKETEEDSNKQSSEDSDDSFKANVVYIDSDQFKRDGVWYDSRYRYTWYSSQVLYHYRTSEWTAGKDGVYRDSDGYVIVSSSDLSQGTIIIDTPFGDCKVYDSGCASGTLDVYVNW